MVGLQWNFVHGTQPTGRNRNVNAAGLEQLKAADGLIAGHGHGGGPIFSAQM
jgi:hypothetical protein